jgi:hypothetical protein
MTASRPLIHRVQWRIPILPVFAHQVQACKPSDSQSCSPHLGDLRSHCPFGINLSPSGNARWCACSDRRVTPTETSVAGAQPIAQESPDFHTLGSVALRRRCLSRLSQTSPQDCHCDQAIDAAALSPRAGSAKISTAIYASSPATARAQRALERIDRRDTGNEASQPSLWMSAHRPADCPCVRHSDQQGCRAAHPCSIFQVSLRNGRSILADAHRRLDRRPVKRGSVAM